MNNRPKYDYGFDPRADNNTAASIYRMASGAGTRVLDLGSGPGVVASALAGEGCDVVCVDSDEEALAVARERGVGRTIVADLVADAWVHELDGQTFDTVVLADVLEHLVDPGRLLDRIREKGLLAADGQLLVSVPNVSHEAVTLGLALGRFRYTETGLLDGTHLRFFTRDSLFALLERHGFLVHRLDRTQRTIEQTEQFQIARDVPTELRRALADFSQDARTYQFVVAAVPSTEAGQLAVLRTRLEDERDAHFKSQEQIRVDLKAQLATATAEVEGLRREAQDVARLREERQAELQRTQRIIEDRAALRSGLADASAERDRAVEARAAAVADAAKAKKQHAEVAREAAELRTALQRAEDRLDLVYESTSFRLGWGLTAPLRAAKGQSGPPVRLERRTGGEARSKSTTRVAAAVAAGLPRQSSPRRAVYDGEIARSEFSEGVRGVVMLCSTTDLDAGRGDVYAACGLGIELRAHGMEAIYLPYERWQEMPEGTSVVVSLLAEESMLLDPAAVPADALRIAWIRNNTKRWIERGSVGLYDLVLCSSQLTADEIRAHHDEVPVELLSLGVDPTLFSVGELDGERDAVLSTINQWGRTRRTFRALATAAPEAPLHLYGRTNNLDPVLAPHSRGLVSYFELPSLYAQAAVVLDDQQGVNAPYGNVNSRIYEALAAGALPISGSPLGLEEAGLGELPVWHRDEELGDALARWTTQDSERDALVERLRKVVLERHTFAQRASRFVELVGAAERRTPTVVGFHPDYRVTNPFQDMVYSSAGDTVVRPTPGPAELLTAPGLQGHRRIFHLHWIATVLNPAGDDAVEAERRARAFLDDLDAARAAGVGFVWTVHNVLLHESRHPELEVRFRQELADRADLVHVLSQATVTATSAAGYELPVKRTYVGIHPSYVGVYPSAVSRAAARRELRLSESAFVYLVLGQIRPYKGLERVLDAFDGLAHDHADVRLLVAGMPGKFAGVEELLERARATAATTVVAEHVEDERLQVFLRAADVVVLPHRRVLNSGLLWLAWSFGRPVVAPDTGALSELVGEEVGVLFDPETDDLRPALEAARAVTPKHGRAAFARARAAEVSQVSRDLFTEMHRAVEGRQQP